MNGNMIMQNTRVILSMILKYYVNDALCSHRSDISQYMISRHAVTLKVLKHSRNVRNTHSRMTSELARHEYHRERLEYNEETVYQMPCNKEEMWKPVCEAWYSVVPNVLKELNSMPQRITDIIKAKEIQRNTDFMM